MRNFTGGLRSLNLRRSNKRLIVGDTAAGGSIAVDIARAGQESTDIGGTVQVAENVGAAPILHNDIRYQRVFRKRLFSYITGKEPRNMNNNLKYDTVFWDIDNTLLDFLAAQDRGIRISLARYGRKADDAQLTAYNRINQKYWEMLERGEVTKAELEIGRFREFLTVIGAENIGGMCVENSDEDSDRTCAENSDGDIRSTCAKGLEEDFDRIAKKINDEYEETLAYEPVLMDGAAEICAALRAMGVRQYAVTNGAPFVQRNKIGLSGLGQYFDALFISEELGYVKPQKEFFMEAVRKIPDYDAGRTIIIGDSLTSDMRGGLHAGIDRCWYNPKHARCTADFPIQYKIAHLYEAKAIVAGERQGTV